VIDEWEWTERFSGQPEIERYLHYVADKFDLKHDIKLNTRVATACFDDTEKWKKARSSRWLSDKESC
jgi:cation diffusion facilitator CzcD-associated flavoprotein CzcO